MFYKDKRKLQAFVLMLGIDLVLILIRLDCEGIFFVGNVTESNYRLLV